VVAHSLGESFGDMVQDGKLFREVFDAAEAGVIGGGEWFVEVTGGGAVAEAVKF